MQWTAGSESTPERNKARQKFNTEIAAEQPTELCQVADGSMVVLSQLTWNHLNDLVYWLTTWSHSRFVLHATPQLQHLHIFLHPAEVMPPPLSLVPRLRSLHLEKSVVDLPTTRSIHLPLRVALNALPCLTSLRCTHVLVSLQDLIDIAAHATLEHIELRSSWKNVLQIRLLLEGVHFVTGGVDIDVGEQQVEDAQWDEWEAQEERAEMKAQPDNRDSSLTAAEDERNIQQLLASLTRVTPTPRSVTARLCLSRYLKRQLYRSRELLRGADRSSDASAAGGVATYFDRTTQL